MFTSIQKAMIGVAIFYTLILGWLKLFDFFGSMTGSTNLVTEVLIPMIAAMYFLCVGWTSYFNKQYPKTATNPWLWPVELVKVIRSKK